MYKSIPSFVDMLAFYDKKCIIYFALTMFTILWLVTWARLPKFLFILKVLRISK